METPWMRQRSFEKCWVFGVTLRKMRSPWMLKSITVRKKGAYVQDSADLSCTEANIPDRITQRVLRRVALSQYI
jgi:hypothetical protein